jgi:hypothetical protein
VNTAITRDPTFFLADTNAALRSVEDGHASAMVPITVI